MHIDEHKNMPEVSGLAQRRGASVATLPPHSFVAPMPPTTVLSSSVAQIKSPSETSYYGYEAALDYGRPSVAPLSPPVLGYPYIPHNPTLDELEACNRRIQAVKLRCEAKRKSTARLAIAPVAPGSCHPGKDALHFATESHLPPGSEVHDDGDSSWDELELNGTHSPHTPSSPQGQMWRVGTHESTALVPEAPFRPYHYEPADLSTKPTDPNAATGDAQRNLPSHSDSSEGLGSAGRELAYALVDQIIYDLNSSVLAFNFPSNLDFITPKTQGALSRLAYTAQNKALLEHKQKLENLLDQLDDIQSNGHEGVRRARKVAVEKVTEAINDLNRMQEMTWYNRLYEQRMGSA